jgi:antitoxin CptB
VSASGRAPGQLVWRCRRGVKELDLILGRWLDRRYAQASANERALFERFLDLPDPELAGYLLQDAKPADPDFAALIAQLAAHSS